jgi:hypothetical protein
MTTFVSIDDDIFGGNGIAYLYAADDVEVTIQPGVLVHSAGGDAIASDRNDSRLINNGQIITQGGVGIQLNGANAIITNNAGGVIDCAHSGIWVNGGSFNDPASARILNYGEISGKSAYGIQFSIVSGGNELINHGLVTGVLAGVGVQSRAADSVISNFGTIEGDQLGIRISSSAFAIAVRNEAGGKIKGETAILAESGEMVLKNKGKVFGDIDCDQTDRDDKVVNKGKIKGDVELGSGDDRFTFVGGKQGEVLGEAGADRFTFKGKLAPEKHVARIGDFTPGEDTIVLSKGLFKGLGEKGELRGKLFQAGNKAADGDDRIIYNESSGKLWNDPDGQGGAKAVLIARLDDGLSLKAGDFLVAA